MGPYGCQAVTDTICGCQALRPRITTGRGNSSPLSRHALGVPTGTESRNEIGITPLADTNLGQQRAYIRLIGRLEHAIRSQYIADLLRPTQCSTLPQLRFGVSSLDVD